MIQSKDDYKFYVDADMRARGLEGIHSITLFKRISAFLIPHPWRFQELLRKAEYYTNVGNSEKNYRQFL